MKRPRRQAAVAADGVIRDAIAGASEPTATAPKPAKAKPAAPKPAPRKKAAATKKKSKPQKYICLRGNPPGPGGRMQRPAPGKTCFYAAPGAKLPPGARPVSKPSASRAQPAPKAKPAKPQPMPSGPANPALAKLGAEVSTAMQAIQRAHPLPAAESSKLQANSLQLHAMHLMHSGDSNAAAHTLAARVRAAVGDEAIQQWLKSAHTVLRAVYFAGETDHINGVKTCILERQARYNPYARQEVSGMKKFNKARCCMLAGHCTVCALDTLLLFCMLTCAICGGTLSDTLPALLTHCDILA